MSFTGREVISGDDLPKADDFAVASAIQLTQKKTRGGGGGNQPQTKNWVPGALQDKTVYESKRWQSCANKRWSWELGLVCLAGEMMGSENAEGEKEGGRDGDRDHWD